jgi:Transcriptional Coactivator p15 (PC4)
MTQKRGSPPFPTRITRTIVTVSRNITVVRSNWTRKSFPPKAADAFPILVAESPRNEREVLRMTLGKYQERISIDVRIWFLVKGGEPRPSRQGISLRLTEISDIQDSLRKAEKIGGGA